MIYPTIPREEFAERCGKVQNILKENGLDLILLYSDDRLTYGNAYGRYFADLQTNFENTLIAFMPGKNPVLLVGPETIGYAFERSAIRDMIVDYIVNVKKGNVNPVNENNWKLVY